MKIIETNHQDWHSQGGKNPPDLPLNPDKYVTDVICQNINSYNSEKTFVKMWFSKIYHDSGNSVEYVQKEINKITENNSREDLVFVCGHIIVNNLDFGKNKVLTYHGSILNDYTVTIPMHPFNYENSNVKQFNEKNYITSFLGSFDTHWSRGHIYRSLLRENNCIVHDTGAWHYYKDKNEQKNFHSEYRKLLSISKTTLCPRGTGPCTIRLWESIFSQSVPIVISDEYKLPRFIDLSMKDICYFVKESDSQNINKFISNICNDDIVKKTKLLVKINEMGYNKLLKKCLEKELNDR